MIEFKRRDKSEASVEWRGCSIRAVEPFYVLYALLSLLETLSYDAVHETRNLIGQ
jgi:hypothetical protein